ncbi:MAG TPA: hypothetical protein VHT70_02605 [Candidatus Saccharimonadales bacterium]|jgi:hypothetical protein|nr:hypothetical protein [Candidatus Saccharimonadales bacterium]
MNGDKKPATTPEGQWDYKQNDADDAMPEQQPPAAVDIQWTASEYIAHQKTAIWYLLLFLATVVIAALVYLVTRDKISTGVVVLVAIIFGAAAGRRPRTLTYGLNFQGITIGNRFYPYSNFRSFSIVTEGAFSSIMLVPLRRFMPSLSIYYAPDDEQRIVEALADRLPVERGKYDLVERFMHRIHF